MFTHSPFALAGDIPTKMMMNKTFGLKIGYAYKEGRMQPDVLPPQASQPLTT